MKDSQLSIAIGHINRKYIKADNERFSTMEIYYAGGGKYIKADNERFSTHRQSRCSQA